jgi:hypothetical protein
LAGPGHLIIEHAAVELRGRRLDLLSMHMHLAARHVAQAARVCGIRCCSVICGVSIRYARMGASMNSPWPRLRVETTFS